MTSRDIYGIDLMVFIASNDGMFSYLLFGRNELTEYSLCWSCKKFIIAVYFVILVLQLWIDKFVRFRV